MPQGGNTGLVGGQIPLHGEVLLSLRRMNQIRAVDAHGMTLTAEAGVTLQAGAGRRGRGRLSVSAEPGARKAAALSAATSPPMPAAIMCCAMA